MPLRLGYCMLCAKDAELAAAKERIEKLEKGLRRALELVPIEYAESRLAADALLNRA